MHPRTLLLFHLLLFFLCFSSLLFLENLSFPLVLVLQKGVINNSQNEVDCEKGTC